MHEIIVKYKNQKALNALRDLAKVVDLVLEEPVIGQVKPDSKRLPITFSKNPDVTALAGIWEGRDITIEQLRKEAWGDRI